MTEQYAVFLDRAKDENDPRCCVTVERVNPLRGAEHVKPQLMLAIHGPDQDASEFLNQKQFEDLVSNARRVMGWSRPK